MYYCNTNMLNRLIMNTELGKMVTKVIVVYFKVLCWHSYGGFETKQSALKFYNRTC